MTMRTRTQQPRPRLPAIAYVVIGDSRAPIGTVRPTNRGAGLQLEGDTLTLRALLEECREDYAYGRAWRRLTNAELLAHLPLRLRFSTHVWAEAYDAAGQYVDTSGILAHDEPARPAPQPDT